MKQAIPNMREIVAEIRAALPGFPASKQAELDAFALRISGELDILEGNVPRDNVEPVPDAPAAPFNVDNAPEGKPAKSAKTPKAPAAE